ncbi:ATP synthase membrane subunit K, mitochondrial-like isoform X2 [Physella acuta]|uniref:ATP synthase membrane subunit K, mitochondrial-like isoform X2 n=1 Tax=Physella acuta TaxID=109671 RepID=UPI0027DE754D|nr:ATP synthase membrane subunit K, mitochondrial-like isoform X2 [Physella acuta]
MAAYRIAGCHCLCRHYTINKYNFIFKMAGDFVPESELNLKGWQKHFNSYTLRGRFNWVAATYGSLFGGFILYKLLKKKPQLTDH